MIQASLQEERKVDQRENLMVLFLIYLKNIIF